MSGFVETNPEPVLRCERCGKALAAADSLCDCDAAANSSAAAADAAAAMVANGAAAAVFANRTAASSAASAAGAAIGTATGAHVCPACGGRFESRELRVFHDKPDIPRYRLAHFGKACPQCATPLRSRHPVGRLRRAVPFGIMSLILGSHLFGLIPTYDGWLRAGLWLAFLLQQAGNLSRERRDPQAYERDPRWPPTAGAATR